MRLILWAYKDFWTQRGETDMGPRRWL